MTKFKAWWKQTPAARVWVRQVVALLGGYVATSIVSGWDFTQLKSIVGGLITAAVTAGVGYLTPAEPSVGLKTDVENPPNGVSPLVKPSP